MYVYMYLYIDAILCYYFGVCIYVSLYGYYVIICTSLHYYIAINIAVCILNNGVLFSFV